MRSGAHPVLSQVARESVQGRTLAIVPGHQLARTVRARIADGATLLWLLGDWPQERPWVRTVLAEPVDVLARVESPLEDAKARYTAVASLVPPAVPYEHEARELCGLDPEGIPQTAPLALAGWSSLRIHPPLSPGFDIEGMPILERPAFFPGEDPPDRVLGPILGSLAEPVVIGLWLDGDRIRRARILGRLKHRGIERLAEGGDVGTALALAERICGCSPVAHAAAFLSAYEEAAGIDPGPQTKAQRSVFTALESISAAVSTLRMAAQALADGHATTIGEALEEEVRSTCERISGHRFLRGMVTAGGLGRPVTSSGVLALMAAVGRLEGGLERLGEAVLAHSGRLSGIGVLPPGRARAYGASGAVLDASDDAGSDVAARLLAWVGWGRRAAHAAREGAGVLAIQAGPRTAPSFARGASGPGVAAFPLLAGIGLGTATGGAGLELCFVRLTGGRIARLAWRPPSIPHLALAEQSLAGACTQDVGLVMASFGACIACASR